MNRLSRLVLITIGLVIAGTAVAVGWLLVTTDADWRSLVGRIQPGSIFVLVAFTASNVLIRFIRWQYLLRRADVRIPTRPSLVIYLASLAAIVTPAYVGETLRVVFARRRYGAPISRTLAVLVGERAFDAFTLAIITMLTADDAVLLGVAAGVALTLALLCILVARMARGAPFTMPAVAALTRSSVLATAALLSFAAWLPTGVLVSLSARSVGEFVPLLLSVQTFSRATLLGGLSLMPAGIGATGSVAIVSLTRAGTALSEAVLIVSVLRLATVGLTLLTGIVCLALLLRRRAPDTRADSPAHFDEIAEVYRAQLPGHIRDLMVSRKTAMMDRHLRESGVRDGRGLDLGCGTGAHVVSFSERNYQIVGIDPSVRSVAVARQSGARVAAAAAEQLPFADGAFDFVYAVGVLHHVPRGVRARAYAEIRRVLRPGGILLVHETNPRNPLFRFYMGYVFPIVRRIDEGTEEWLDPQTLTVPGMETVATDYVTFLPDFLPHFLLARSLRLEERLEHSRWRLYAVHYLKIFRASP